MDHPIIRLRDELKERITHVSCVLDCPSSYGECWYLDVSLDGRAVSVEWRADRGFGITTSPIREGVGPDRITKDIEEAYRIVSFKLGVADVIS